jgi:hypothetical protein
MIKNENLIGKPIAIRHHYSGVWMGIFLGEGLLPHIILIEGRRVWSWSGDRLEFSELCAKGVRKEDRLGMWTKQHIPVGPGDGLVELTFDISQKTIDKARKL